MSLTALYDLQALWITDQLNSMKLRIVVINNSGGTIDTEKQVKRVKFIGNEYAQNPKGVALGISCLKGSDTGGTNLWWDVD